MTLIRVNVNSAQLTALLKQLDPANLEAGLHTGLSKSGQIIAAKAREIVRPHHFTGHFEQQIHVEVTGSGLNQTARIGVNSAEVPEARPLSYGWASMSGKQPPIDAIARWIARKPEIGSSVSSNIGYNAAGQRRTTGTLSAVSQESRVRSLAFLIARAIGKRGYSSKTPPLRVFENAYQQSRSQVEATMLRALKWRAE